MIRAEDDHRLPFNVTPVNYKLHLKPDLQDLTFSGDCLIELDVVEETDQIICNSNNLIIKSVSVNKKEVDKGGIQVDEVKERLILKLGYKLPVGKCQLDISFTGVLNDQMRGFYRSKYQINGEQRFSAVTQFASTDARKCFPCWDEPARKATFDVTVTGPADRVILSNTQAIHQVLEGDKKTVKFAQTPVMSTYLLAIVVGEFDHVEGFTVDNIKVRVYTPVGRKDQGTFALNCGIKALEFFTKFFKIPYPLDKYDMIGISDFLFGAMENWGLVTYRESRILVDPVTSSSSAKDATAQTICHETAHQWFGNLVTMEWWTDLWLNEGFASFMQYLATDSIFPEFKVFEKFVPETLIRALNLDCLSSSHPIEVEVKDPADINQIFDTISYCKGGSILRMLYTWIGEESFQKGLQKYLTKYQHSNAKTEDLWKELESESGQPVSSVMSNWTLQLGYPTIDVKSRQEGTRRIISLKQSKHILLKDDSESMLWKTPISIITKDGRESIKVILEDETLDVVIEDLAPDAWFKLNQNFTGFYRVNYCPTDMENLVSGLKDGELNSLDRLNILDDLFSLVLAGKTNTTEWLNLVQTFSEEESYIVWRNITDNLCLLHSVLSEHQECKQHLNQFIQDLYSKIRLKFGWNSNLGDDHLSTLLRSKVLSILCKAGELDVITEGLKRFTAHVDGTRILTPDLRVVAYECAGMTGEDKYYRMMLDMYQNTDSSEEKERILGKGIGSFNNQDILRRALDFGLSEKVRAQDTIKVFASVANNDLGRELAWNSFKGNVDMLKERYGSGHLMTILVKSVIENFSKESDTHNIQQFFKANDIPGIERSLSQGLERIQINSSWLNRDIIHIKSYLQKFTN